MNTNITKKQVAIVTGASSGMGLGITQALLQHGYHVVANSRNIGKSKDLKPSSDLILVDGDISKTDSAIKVADAAIKHFTRAIELDSEFALAHDGLGACYVNRVFKGLGGVEDFENAEAAFNRALQNDPNIAEARMLMVFKTFFCRMEAWRFFIGDSWMRPGPLLVSASRTPAVYKAP